MELNPSTIFIGLGSVGVFGLIYFIVNKFFSGSGSKKEFIESMMNKKIKEKREEIKNISKKEEIIVKQIRESEKQSEEVKKKIDEKFKQTAKEVEQILKENDLSKIDEQIDKEWDDL